MKKIQRAGLAVKQKVKEGIQILKEDSRTVSNRNVIDFGCYYCTCFDF